MSFTILPRHGSKILSFPQRFVEMTIGFFCVISQEMLNDVTIFRKGIISLTCLETFSHETHETHKIHEKSSAYFAI